MIRLRSFQEAAASMTSFDSYLRATMRLLQLTASLSSTTTRLTHKWTAYAVTRAKNFASSGGFIDRTTAAD